MIGWLAARAIAAGIPAKYGRAVAKGVTLLALVALVFTVWHCSVDNAVDNRNAKQTTANAKQREKAVERTGTRQRADDGRISGERAALGGTKHNATVRPLSDSERKYLRCVRLQQSARTRGERAPAC